MLTRGVSAYASGLVRTNNDTRPATIGSF